MTQPPKDRDRIEQEGNQEDDQKAFVGQYTNTAQWPLEVGEIVWIVKPGCRMPLGEFLIDEARSNGFFGLVSKADGQAYSELVEGQYLTRDPFTPCS